MTSDARSRAMGITGACVAMLLVGSAVAATSRLTGYPVLAGQAIRYSATTVILLAVLRRRGPIPRLDPRSVARVFVLGTSGLTGYNVFLLLALRSAEPAAVGVVVGCLPIVLAVIGPLVSRPRSRPALRVTVAAVVVVAGAAVVQGAGRSSMAAAVFSLGALAGEATFSLAAIPLLGRLTPLDVSAFAGAAATVELVVLAPMVEGTPPAPTVSQAAALAFLTAATAVAFVCWYAAIVRLGVDRAGLCCGLVPVGALLGGAIVTTGPVAWPQVAGTALVAAGVVVGLAGRSTCRRATA